MGVNVKRMKEAAKGAGRKDDFWTIKNGQNIVYIHPPCRPDDKDDMTEGTNFIKLVVHFNVGKSNNMVVCLDKNNNKILRHPFVQEWLKQREIELTGNCPVCKKINSNSCSEKDTQLMRPQYKYLWGVFPLQHRMDSEDEWEKNVRKPLVVQVGKTVHNGLMELFYDHGDITDYKAAVYAKITKSGKGLKTKYVVTVDKDTFKKPKVLGEKFVNIVESAMKDKCELFKIVADTLWAEKDVAKLLSGIEMDEEPDDLDYDDIVEDDVDEEKAERDRKDEEELDEVFGVTKGDDDEEELDESNDDDDGFDELSDELDRLASDLED